jgi:FkbM family methyltransferase
MVSPVDIRDNCIVVSDHYGVTTNAMGKFIYNLHDPCILDCMQILPTELADLEQFVHGTVFDIGANVGVHSIFFSKRCNQVYSFEPQPQAYNELCANLLLNTVYNVTPIRTAVGNYDGTIKMPLLNQEVPNSCAGISVDQGDMDVPMRRLDTMKPEAMDFMKIDVEGYEVEVIKGAIETIQLHRPIIFIEVHAQENVDPLKDIFRKLGYTWKQLNHQGGYPINPDGKTLSEELVILTLGYLFWMPEKIIWQNDASSVQSPEKTS